MFELKFTCMIGPRFLSFIIYRCFECFLVISIQLFLMLLLLLMPSVDTTATVYYGVNSEDIRKLCALASVWHAV